MKKRIAGLFAFVAMLATVASSSGCIWFNFDEPKSLGLFKD